MSASCKLHVQLFAHAGNGWLHTEVYSVSQKKILLRFSDIFPERLGIFSPNTVVY